MRGDTLYAADESGPGHRRLFVKTILETTKYLELKSPVLATAYCIHEPRFLHRAVDTHGNHRRSDACRSLADHGGNTLRVALLHLM